LEETFFEKQVYDGNGTHVLCVVPFSLSLTGSEVIKHYGTCAIFQFSCRCTTYKITKVSLST